MNLKPGDLVRSKVAVFDVMSPDAKSWMIIDPESVCLVLPITSERFFKDGPSWVRILTPEGVGDCYHADLEKVG